MNWKRKYWIIITALVFLYSACNSATEAPSTEEATKLPANTPETYPFGGEYPAITPVAEKTELLSLGVYFLIDTSESINSLCNSDAQKNLRYQIPSFFISTIKQYNNKQLDMDVYVGIGKFSTHNENQLIQPIQDVDMYNDSLMQDFSSIINRFSDGEHYIDMGLKFGRDLLLESGMSNKVIVIISDGWFYKDYTELRDPTRSALNEIQSQGIKVMFVRLDCPPPLSYTEVEEDLDMWENALTHDNVIVTSQTLYAIKKIISHEWFSGYLPQNGKWWTTFEQPSMSIDNVPGEASKVILKAVYTGEIDKITSNMGEKGRFDHSGDGVFGGEIDLEPNQGCNTQTNILLYPEGENLDQLFLIYYWWVYETQEYKFDINMVSDNIVLLNNSKLSVNSISIWSSNFSFYNDFVDSFNQCYKVGWRLIDRDNEIVLDSGTFDINNLPKDWRYEYTPPEYPPFDSPRNLQFIVEIIKYPNGDSPVPIIWEVQNFAYRFTPKIEPDYKIDCELESEDDAKCILAIPIRYMDGRYHTSENNVIPQIWGFTRKSGKAMDEVSIREKCQGFYPPDDKPIFTSYYAVPLWINNKVDKGIVNLNPARESTTLIEIGLKNSTINMCGFEIIGIFWENPDDETGMYWQDIICNVSQKICEEKKTDFAVMP